MTRFPHLLAAGAIGKMRLRNRVFMCPMGDSLANTDGTVSGRQLDYFEARAAGGTALLIVGSVSVSYPAGSFAATQTAASTDAHRTGLRRLADRVHQHGARIAAQLVHDGGNSLYDIEQGRALLLPSLPSRPRPDRISQMVTPDEITKMTSPFTASTSRYEVKVADEADIEAIIELYASAAARCIDAGFDAIELHGGHGYLLDTFRSGYTNQRDDRWGSDLDGRSRLMREVIGAVRARVGSDVPVWMRLNAFEVGRPGGATLDETLTLAPQLVAAGLDALHVSAYASNDLAIGVTASHTPHTPGLLVPAAAAVRAVVDVPVITFGRLEPELADEVIANGSADFVAMGRQLLADPDLVNKLIADRVDDVRPCLYQYRCIGNIFVRGSVACVANPETAREAELAVPRARSPRRVLVVGGGPSGLEAARRLAASGHAVTLADRGTRLGGRLALGGYADETLDRFVGWLARGAERVGVEFQLGATVNEDDCAGYDEIVVATGATWGRGDFVTDPRVRSLDDLEPWLQGRQPLTGPLVFVGGGKVALTLAAHARTQGIDTTVVEASGVFAPELGLPGRFRLVHDVETAGTTLLRGVTQSLEPAGLRVEINGVVETLPAETIVVTNDVRPIASLANALAARGVRAHRIGDCRDVRRIEGAMIDAAELAVAMAQ